MIYFGLGMMVGIVVGAVAMAVALIKGDGGIRLPW